MAFGDSIMAGMGQGLPTSDPIMQSLAQNALQPQQAQPQAPAYHQPSFLSNVLGALGDAFLVQSGHQPMYAAQQQQRKRSAMLANYLGQVGNGELANMLNGGLDPGDAVDIYHLLHPADEPMIAEMKAVGIDPTSEEGKGIIRNKLTGSDDASIREYNLAKSQGYTGSYMDYRQALGGPIGFTNGDGTYTLIPRSMVNGGQPKAAPSSAPAPGTIEDGYRFKGGDPSKQENWEPTGHYYGGATGNTPSHTFP